MPSTEELILLAGQVGFSHSCELNMDSLVFREDVRAMCDPKRCRSYGHTWSCPPALGPLSESREKASKYHRGILVQTTGRMENDFDIHSMLDTGKRHKKLFDTLVRQVRHFYPDCLPMGAGECGFCAKCTYPDKPCRFPEHQFISMEAYGLMVLDVCKASGMQYDYGPKTVTYVSCILID